jgi:hypothetical protein
MTVYKDIYVVNRLYYQGLTSWIIACLEYGGRISEKYAIQLRHHLKKDKSIYKVVYLSQPNHASFKQT